LGHCKSLDTFLRNDVVNNIKLARKYSILYIVEKVSLSVIINKKLARFELFTFCLSETDIKKLIFICNYYIRILEEKIINAIKSIYDTFEEATVSI